MPGPLWPKVPFSPGGAGGVRVQDEGNPLGVFSGFNFTGGGVTVVIGPTGFVTVIIPTGAGIAAGDGLFEGPPGTVNVGNIDGSIVVSPDAIAVSAAIQAGAALGATSVQDVVEMYGPGAGTVQGVSVTPGWQVLVPGAFEWSNALSDPYVQAIFRVIALVTDASLTGRIRLFDQTAGVQVASSVLSTSSLTDVVLTTANILADLIDGHTYQFQAEATGGVADAGFIFVRSAVLICQL